MIPTLKRYVIEREIPGVGKLSREQLKQTAMTSLEPIQEVVIQEQ